MLRVCSVFFMAESSGAGEAERPTLPGDAGAGGDTGARKVKTLIDGRYEIESELGIGGMGIVYLGRDVGLDRPVALKVIAPAWSRDTSIATRFQQEARALASVRSPHVVQIYAFGRHGDSYFFAMEYVRGRSLDAILEEHLKHGARLPSHRALTIFAKVAEGVSAVHAAGIIHGDVKPANIVIEEDTGRPVLVDFGLAGHGAEVAEFGGGTPSYAAPEQAGLAPNGAVVSTRSDVYALGCTAFEMLTGHLPFEVKDPLDMLRCHAREPPPKASRFVPGLAAFDPIFEKALAKAPDARHETVAAFSAALAKAAISIDKKRERSPTDPPRRVPGQSRPLEVLVVDDDPDFRKFAVRAVKLAFFGMRLRVHAAMTGAEALASGEQETPDLVLLDFDMPGFDGVQTLSEMREMPLGERARVVVMSTPTGLLASRWRFSVLGVQDFLAKPIELKTLVETLAAIGTRAGWTGNPEFALTQDGDPR
jgi:serine/threonine protein kinase